MLLSRAKLVAQRDFFACRQTLVMASKTNSYASFIFSRHSLALRGSDGNETSLAFQRLAIASFHLGLYSEAKAAFRKAQEVN